MPNYSLVVDATYDPLSYAEISAPIKEAAAYHQALQDSYDKMQLATAMYAPYVKDDPVAKEMYDRYMGQLNSATEALLNRGAWGQRERLSQARKSYGEDMVPIETAFKKREAEAAAQAQGRARGLEFSRDAATSKLSYYFDNPNGGYQIADPKQITGILAASASAFTKQLRGMDENERAIFAERAGLPPSLIATVVNYGMSAQDIMNWRNHPYMVAMMQNALGSVGMTIDDHGNAVANDVWDVPSTNRVLNAAISGFAAGAGEDKVNITEDPEWAAMQRMNEIAARTAATAKEDYSEYPSASSDSFTLNNMKTNDSEFNAAVGTGKRFLKFDEKTQHFIRQGFDSESPYKYFNSSGKVMSYDEFYKANIGYTTSLAKQQAGLSSAADPNVMGTGTRQSAKDLLDAEWKTYSIALQNAGLKYDSKRKMWTTQSGARASGADVTQGYNQHIDKFVGKGHSVNNTRLQYNSLDNTFKNLGAYQVDSFDKNGRYRRKTNNAISLSSIPNIENATIGVDTSPGTEGFIIVAPNGDGNGMDTYHIPYDNIRRSDSIRQAYDAYKQALAMYGDSRYFPQDVRQHIDNMFKGLMLSMGQGNTVSNMSINGGK